VLVLLRIIFCGGDGSRVFAGDACETRVASEPSGTSSWSSAAAKNFWSTPGRAGTGRGRHSRDRAWCSLGAIVAHLDATVPQMLAGV
jgi:hypothetical protein